MESHPKYIIPMAYIQQDDKHLITDIITRKEFYWNKRWDHSKYNSKYSDIIPKFLLNKAITNSKNLRLMSYQSFTANYANPNTPYQRLLLKWQTGTGKSIGLLSIAMNFINFYRLEKELNHTEIGTVFIVGFSERVFKNELLAFPEFGFLSKKEKSHLEKLKYIAVNGSKKDVERYRDMITKIKKRFGNRKGNGFFKFYGYKAFVNRILKTQSGTNLNDMSESQIREAIKSGKITYNEELIHQFKNSLLICDEIHNVYNSLEKNNWGVALQAVLDKEPTCRAIFASATPINNQAWEVIDLLNLLLPSTQRLNKHEFFTKKGELSPGALEKIAELSRGRISYLRDVNPQYYPSVEMHGETLSQIAYLKFIRCPMSSFHYNTYKEVYTGTLSQDSQYLVDFCLENPDKNSKLGIYQTNIIKTSLASAPQSWKDKYGLDYLNDIIVGDGLKRDSLVKYSSKYVAVLDQLSSIIKNGGGNTFIYHNIVHMSGVLFIEQVLRQNGYIDEFSSSNDTTLCIKCGKTRKQHSKREIAGGFDDSFHSFVTYGGADYNTVYGDEDDSCGVYCGGVSGGAELFVENDSKFASVSPPEVKLIKNGRDLWWMRGERYMLTIHKKKDPKCYLIPASGIDNSIINGKSSVLRQLSDLFNNLDNIPIIIQVPNYAPRLGEWLLHSGFKLGKQTDNYTQMILHDESSHTYKAGGRSRVRTGDRKKARVTILKKPKSSISGKFNHAFVPARYVIAHSEIDKGQMEHSIEKFNNAENANGDRYMILIGSKIIKESYDIKAIQNIFITGRPDNIPTLLQIRGRGIRKNSHRNLPPEKRKVNIYIFTTCLPTKIESGKDKGAYQLSYEEQKYKEKIETFKTIQKIEKTLHENAIDAVINRDINVRESEIKDPLEALPFEPNVSDKFKKELSLKDLNTTTFDIYHAHKEINAIKHMIKRLYIEILTVWEYKDLFAVIKEDPYNYQSELNTQLFTEANFMIALHQLSWNNNPQKAEPVLSGYYVEDTADADKALQDIIDKLYDPSDKIITLPGGQDSIIIPIPDGDKQYFILFPVDIGTHEPIIDIELPYRVMKHESKTVINMNSFIQNKRVDFDYEDKKKIFYRKYIDISIENMENVVCEYGTSFHVKFLEECVEYVFRVWTDPHVHLSEYHEFYFKMLYYYDLLSLVMWCYTSKPRVFKEYTKYAIPVKAKDIKLKAMMKYEKRKEELEDISPDDTSDLATSGVINLLKSSINRTSNVWIPSEFREQFDQTINDSYELFRGSKKKSSSISKVSAKLLPIGHYISQFPRVFHPERGWSEDPTYVQHDQEYIENDTIIGYDEKSRTGVHVRFKIRNPIHNIRKHKDSRLIEKGTVCKSKSKTYLRNLAKKIDIILPEKFNVDDLCVMMRSKLIRLELKERIKKSKIKYFYFHYEQQMPQ